ncbi:MAG: sigma-70 family RNA polymerase sigma factor [Acidobacteriota bacterium]
MSPKGGYTLPDNFTRYGDEFFFESFINGYRKKQSRPAESAFSEIEGAFESMVRDEPGSRPVRNPEEEILDEVLDEDVQAALDSLSEDYRMAIMLVDLEDFSYKEAASILEIPVGTVMSRLYRGRRQLEKVLLRYAQDHGYLREGAPQKMRSRDGIEN